MRGTRSCFGCGCAPRRWLPPPRGPPPLPPASPQQWRCHSAAPPPACIRGQHWGQSELLPPYQRMRRSPTCWVHCCAAAQSRLVTCSSSACRIYPADAAVVLMDICSSKVAHLLARASFLRDDCFRFWSTPPLYFCSRSEVRIMRNALRCCPWARRGDSIIPFSCTCVTTAQHGLGCRFVGGCTSLSSSLPAPAPGIPCGTIAEGA